MVHATRAARKHREANEFDERVKKQTKELREELKQKRAEVNVLLDQVASGVEMVGQGDLLADGSTEESRAADAAAAAAEGGRVSPEAASLAIAEVATRAGDVPPTEADGTGDKAFDFTGEEPSDTIVGAPQNVAPAAKTQPSA